MMIIEETLFCDTSNFDDAKAAKLELAESIILSFTPFFSDEIERKRQKLRDCKQDLAKLKTVIAKSQDKQKALKSSIVKEQKKATILDDLDVLLNHNVLFGKNKDLAKKIFMRINELGDSELDKASLLLSKLVRQNIKQVIP